MKAAKKAAERAQMTCGKQKIFRSFTDAKASLNDDWYDRWIYAIHENQIPDTGDYITLQIGHYPVILVRNQSNDIVALNNSCRHRGSRICQEEKGSAPNLVCPYHQWTYDLNGELLFARNMMEEIDITELPLKQFPVTMMNGLVFVQLAAAEASFEPLGERWRDALNSSPQSDAMPRLVGAEHRQLLEVPWEGVMPYEHPSAACVFEERNFSVWRAADHWAVMRVLPLNLFQSEIAIQCLVHTEQVADTELQPHRLLAQWGIESAPEEDASPSDQAALLETLPSPADQEVEESLNADLVDFADLYSNGQIWDSRTQLLECTLVVQETHNVKSFTFKAVGGGWFKFKPGQFVTLELPAEDGPILRTYTISSSPSRAHCISVTVKAQPNSIGTRWLFDNVKVGDRLRGIGPGGEFTLFNKPATKYLFISAGSGITPMLSMTRWLYDFGYDLDVNFISCVNEPSDLLFKDELEMMASRCPMFRLTWVCADDSENRWTGYRGHFNRLLLGSAAPDYIDREVFCCGPAPFMQAVREALSASGFNMDHYNEESFGAPAPLEPLPDEVADPVVVTFGQSGKTHESHTQETLLQAAKSADIAIPSACGFGVCGTCKVKVRSGETHMVHSGGISQKEIDAGYVLACCSTPKSDTTIEI